MKHNITRNCFCHQNLKEYSYFYSALRSEIKLITSTYSVLLKKLLGSFLQFRPSFFQHQFGF